MKSFTIVGGFLDGMTLTVEDDFAPPGVPEAYIPYSKGDVFIGDTYRTEGDKLIFVKHEEPDEEAEEKWWNDKLERIA